MTTRAAHPAVLASDGTFQLDTSRPRAAWESVERALEAWYADHPSATLWISTRLPDMITWLIREHCSALSPGVKVYTHSALDAGRGRLE